MDRDESPELIEQQMTETRQSLTEKVAALENQVTGTLQSATTTVQETVQTVQDTVQSVKTAMEDTVSTVKDTVQESVESVSSGIKSAFDVRSHVADNPWGAFAGAAVAGFVTGLIVFRHHGHGVPAHPAAAFTPRPAPPPAPAAAPAPPPEPRKPSWVDDLFDMATREAKQIGQQALSTLAASAKHAIDQQMPLLVNTLAERLPTVMAGGDRGDAARPAAGTRTGAGFQHYT